MGQLINYNTRKSVYDKLRKYIFNPEHEEGWPKGRWFMLALGFNPANLDHVKMLARQIQFDISRAIFQRSTEDGEVYRMLLSITGANNKTIDGIRTVWQKDHGSDFIRLLTIYPPKGR